MKLNSFINDIKQNPAAALLAIIMTAISLATTFLVLVLCIEDNKTERGVPEPQALFRIESQFNLPNGETVRSAKIPFPLVDALQKQADIESVSYAYRLDVPLHHAGHSIPQVTVFAVTPEFIEQLRPYPEHLPPPGPHDIYITADFNRQYLGLDDPLGKTIDLGESGQFTIKAIIEARPDSSLKLPAIIAFSAEKIPAYDEKRLDWYDTHVYTFARLRPAVTGFNQQILDNIVTSQAPPLPGAPFTPSAFLHFSAKNILDMHYDEGYADEFIVTRNKSLLSMLYTAALFVLFSTIANFFNINGVINNAKRQDLHIKRSIGASNAQLLSESLHVLIPQFLIATILAALFICLLIPLIPDIRALLTHQSISLIAMVFFISVFFTGFVFTSSYLINFSGFVFAKPTASTVSRYQNRSIHYLNRTLLMLQLVIAGITVYLWAGMMTQTHTLTQADFGYQQTQRLTFTLDKNFYSLSQIRELEQKLKGTFGTLALSLSNWQPFDRSRQVSSVQHAQQTVDDQFTTINTLSADKEFIHVWGLTTLAGQANTVQASSDEAVSHIIVTRAFVKAMGQKTFDEVLNSRYSLSSAQQPQQPQELRVIRIIEDFDTGEHLASPQPLIIFIHDRMEKFATLSFAKPENQALLIRALKDYGPPGLTVQSVEELHNRHFYNDRQMLNIIMITAILALVLMVVSTLAVSLSEIQRLNHTLKIMESVGGSVATSLVFFLRQHVVPLVFSFLIALICAYFLQKHLPGQHEWTDRRVYLHAFAALLSLNLLVVAIMTLSLVLCGSRSTHRQLKRK